MTTRRMTLLRPDDDLDVLVDFSSWRAYRGSRDSFGVPLEPDEPGGVEIEEVRDATTKEILTLTKDEIAELENKIIDEK